MIEFAKAPAQVMSAGPVEFAKAEAKDPTDLAELLKEREAAAQVVVEREKLAFQVKDYAHQARVFGAMGLVFLAAAVAGLLIDGSNNIVLGLFSFMACGSGSLLGVGFTWLTFEKLAERKKLKKRLATS